MHRILEFISYPSHSRTLGVLAVLVVLLSIPLTVNIAQKQQELRQHAETFSGPICGGGTCIINIPPNGVSNPTANQVLPPGWTYNPNGPATYTGGTGGQSAGGTTGGQAPAGSGAPAATAGPTNTAAPTAAASSITDCPNNAINLPHSGNTQVWGGRCNPSGPSGGALAFAIPNTCTCTVADCELYPGTTSTYCWVNNGQVYPPPGTDPASIPQYIAQCNAKQAGLPASCSASPGPTATAAPATGTTVCAAAAGSGRGSCTASQTLVCTDGSAATFDSPNNRYCCPGGTPFACQNANYVPPSGCTEASRTPCTAPPNYCGGGQGTQTVTYTGSTCTTSSAVTSCSNAVDNCSSGNVCPSGSGQRQCVASGTPASTTPPSGSTILTFSNIKLDGIGRNDGKPGSVNPPSNGLRPITVTVLDASNNQKAVLTGSIIYSNGSWTTGTSIYADSATVPTGQYNFKIKASNYINRLYSASITGGQSNDLSNGMNLPTGDIDGTGTVDIADLRILISCSVFSTDNGAVCGANSAYKGLSDLNNDGVVDQYDYNLILRELGKTDQ